MCGENKVIIKKKKLLVLRTVQSERFLFLITGSNTKDKSLNHSEVNIA